MKTFTFSTFWFAKTSIALSDVIYIMVITTFIFQKTNSALIASLFPLFKAVANLLAGLTSPFLYKKFTFTRLLIVLQLLKATVISVLLIGFIPITSQIYILLSFILIISFTEGWGTPLLNSVTPKIVEKNKLVKANSLLSISTQSVQIAGYSFTGIAVLKWGHLPTLLLSAALVWISAVCLIVTSLAFENSIQKTGEKQSKLALMKEGWGLIWSNSTLRTVTLMDVIEGMAGSIWIGAITLVYVTDALDKSEQWWGYINASYYLGAILGGILTLSLAKRIQNNLIVSMAFGSLLFSILVLTYGLTSLPLLALVLCVAMGPAYQIRDVAQQTAFQLNIESELLPKVYATQSILTSTITGLSIFLMGFIADFIGVRAVYILGAILIFSSALLSFSLVQANKKKIEMSI